MQKFIYIVALFLIGCCISDVAAEQAEDASIVATTSRLNAIVVTATRTPEQAGNVPVFVQTISRRQIETSGATHAGDLIAKYATGHYHRYAGMLAPIGLRGFRTASHGDDIKGHVLVLVDGHRVGTGNLAKLSLDNVEKVEIIKGPASALYGSAAMGGVVNIITRKGQGIPGVSLKQEAGSFGYLKSSLSSSGDINDQWAYHLHADYEDVGNYSDPTFGEVFNTEEEHKNVSGNLLYSVSDHHRFRLGGSYADLLAHNPAWKDGTYSEYDSENTDFADKSHAFADAEYNGRFLDEQLEWKAQGYYLWDINQWFTGDPNPEDSFTKYTDTTFGMDHRFAYTPIHQQKVIAGFTYDALTKVAEGLSGGEPSRPYTPGMDYRAASVFAHDVTKLLGDRLNIVVGARYDRFDITTKRPETGDFQSFNERTVHFDHLSPKGGLTFRPHEQLRVRANAGTGFKAPSADQMSAMYEYAGWNGSLTRILGNPDLKPETSMTIDAGFDISHTLADFGFTFFHTNYKDKIQRAGAMVTYQGEEWRTWENLGNATIAGFDLNLNVPLHRILDLDQEISLYSNVTLNTTYEDTENQTKLQYISDYEAKSGIHVRHAATGTQATLSHVLIGPQQYTNWDDWSNPLVETKETFSFVDVVVQQRVWKGLVAEASVLNLLNQDYEWVRGYPMPERHFRFGLSWAFQPLNLGQ